MKCEENGKNNQINVPLSNNPVLTEEELKMEPSNSSDDSEDDALLSTEPNKTDEQNSSNRKANEQIVSIDMKQAR